MIFLKFTGEVINVSPSKFTTELYFCDLKINLIVFSISSSTYANVTQVAL